MNIKNNQESNEKKMLSSSKTLTSLYDIFGVKKHEYDKKIKLETQKKIISFKNNNDNKSTNIINNNEIEEDNFLKINTKNQFDIYDSEESSKKLNEILKYIQELTPERSNKEMSKKFLEKLFPRCKRDSFLISKNISKRIMKSKKINKKIIEDKLTYFFSNRIELRYSKKFILNKDNINNIGYILCYSYSKFDDMKILNKKDLLTYLELSKKVDVLNDFYNNCNETGKSPLDNNKLDFLESKSDKYHMPGEFLFLMNCFEYINILEIDINEINKSKQQHDDDFYLFIITLLNIHYIMTLTDHLKVNFNNQQLQEDIYNYFTEELNKVYKSHNRHLKKNKEFSKSEIFKKRWDFETNYLITKQQFYPIEEDNIIHENKIEDNEFSYMTNITNRNMQNEDNNLSYIDPDKKSELEYSQYLEKKSRAGSLYVKPNDITSLSFMKSQTQNFEDLISIEQPFNRNLTFSEININNIVKDKYIKIVDKNKNILELIYIVVLGILHLKLKKLDLFMNDCYYKEFVNTFGHITSSSSSPSKSSNVNDFHILDFFIKKLKTLIIFNIEFNSLDYLAFYRLLSILKNNDQLNCLQISFFSSLISYSPQYIYKLYTQNLDKKEVEKGIYSPEYYLLNELLGYFTENLEVLFELIKLKNLEILSLTFDVPEIISSQQRYLNSILKFILNILFLAGKQKSKIKKLVILSPKTVFDSRTLLNIEDIIDTIDIDNKNRAIRELSIQVQFFRIHNIKNIISHNLINLNIGDIDIYTLKDLTKYLCSYNYYKNSLLKSLTIGILNFIVNFSKDVEYLFNELFSIKIKTLRELNIYSNIYIREQNDFYKILENNWIPSCILTLNEKSELSWKKNEIDKKINQIMGGKNKTSEKPKEKKIFYLLHHQLEEEILTPNEVSLRNKKKMKRTDCEVAWYLKYLLIFRYSKKNKDNENNINYYDVKNIIFNILKFLYFTKTAKIGYKLS